jgi:hypothetical protein
MMQSVPKHWIDLGAWGFAIVAGISLAQAALIATILAGLASFVLALIRVYDRIKYGPDTDK